MAEYDVAVAAATAVLGYDMFRDEPWTVSDHPRVISGLAVCGSAAGGDSAIDLKVGQYTSARRYNSTTGLPTKDHLTSLSAGVPAGAKISCPVIDAPVTNPLNIKVTVEDL